MAGLSAALSTEEFAQALSLAYLASLGSACMRKRL